MSKLTYSLAATAAVVMLAAGSTGAMAGGKHFRHHGLGVHFNSMHHFHHHHRPVIRFSYGYAGCGYLYDRWMDTGRFYWKRQYYQCKGWW